MKITKNGMTKTIDPSQKDYYFKKGWQWIDSPVNQQNTAQTPAVETPVEEDIEEFDDIIFTEEEEVVVDDDNLEGE